MGRGLGHIQRAILAHLQNDPRSRGATVRTLAQAVYGLGTAEPSGPQVEAARWAVWGLERRGLVVERSRIRARPTRDVLAGAARGGEGALGRGVKVGWHEMTVVTLAPQGDTCRGCGAPIMQKAAGRRRVWCSELCRHRAWNRERSRARG